MVEAKPSWREAIVKGLADRLNGPGSTNATLNAYLILILRCLDAEEAALAIRAAFE